MAYIKQSDFVFDCSKCHTRCDGVSKGVYIFDNDVTFSEDHEQQLMDKINSTGKYIASKCEIPGYPDVEVLDLNGDMYCYVEVKVQRRAFMSVERHLPHSNLKPSETVALNLSDLLRYFDIYQTTKTNIVVAWFLKERLCITGEDSYLVYFQRISELQKIYNEQNKKRTFKRKSGEGDVVDGVHKGVTVNYHFSLKELQLWKW